MKPLVFVSMENWDQFWRRNQFVCAELTRRHTGTKILFLGVQRNVWRLLRAGSLRAIFGHASRTVEGYPDITVTSALRIMPERYHWGIRFNEWLTLRHLRALIRKLALRHPVLWLNPHYAVHLVGKLEESAVIYDITDDWELMIQPDEQRDRTRAQDAELGRVASAVIVCSEQLQHDKERKFARPVHLIPNGVDAEHYREVLDGTGPLPEAARAWSKPVLGYTGTVHGQRVDVGLVAALARAFPAGSIVLVGPNHLTPVEQAQLAACGNVHLPGPVPYAEIPRWMRAFDVCIVPHLVTNFTDSLNPIKLWEYLASGKPIISTPVAGFRDYPRQVRLAEGVDAFTGAIQDGLREEASLVTSRREEARKHSWASRVDRIEVILRECGAVAEVQA